MKIWDNIPVTIEPYEDVDGADIYYDHGNGITFWVFENSDIVNLVVIDIPKKMQGKGLGKSMIQDYVSYCDKVRKQAVLTPIASKTHTKEQLIGFYSKFGFGLKNGKMYRPLAGASICLTKNEKS